MIDISITARSPSATLTCHGHGPDVRGKAMDRALEVRLVTRSEKDRFEAAMTMAFSADPAARWAEQERHVSRRGRGWGRCRC